MFETTILRFLFVLLLLLLLLFVLMYFYLNLDEFTVYVFKVNLLIESRRIPRNVVCVPYSFLYYC